jgi:TetR/AcrR family transcriptional regulator, cholesterol catabolism regulator
VFMKFGIKSVTMDDIARELAVSKKTIYKLFSDKNDLVRSIIEHKVELDRAECLHFQHNSENAVDALFNVSRFVIENLSNINPSVIYDLQKYHPDAWQIMVKHKWDFVLSMIRNNIERGIKEGVYRADMEVETIARLYVGSTDLIIGGDVFPWPEFKFDKLFHETVYFHIRGMANEKGLNYLEVRKLN